MLAYRRSPAFIVYVLFVFAFNRGLRRWMDFAEGGFQSRTVLSLLPLTVMLCAALPVALHFHKLPGRVRGAMVLFSLALAYALLLGAGRGPAAVIEVVQYLAPLLLLGYVLIIRTRGIHGRRLAPLAGGARGGGRGVRVGAVPDHARVGRDVDEGG